MALGYHDVDELLSRLSSSQLTEWQAYYQIEPWGEKRADLRAGIIASVIANGPFKKRDFGPQDFFPNSSPKPPEDSPPKSPEEILKKFDRIFGINQCPQP